MYMYAKGTKNTHTNPIGTMVQIVKGELRKIGDWTTYATGPLDKLTNDDKEFVGWYWYNTNKERRYWMEDETLLALKGKKAGLFDQLYKIYKNDNAFFHAIADRLEHVHVWIFEQEIERRQDMFDHTPREAKYVIYNADDYGRTEGEPMGTAIVTTTGDPRADEITGIRRYLTESAGVPEDTVMGAGFYNAVIFDEYAGKRDEHIADLKAKLDAALDSAVWSNT